MRIQDLRRTIREIPDFPKPGIVFYDVTTLFGDRRAFRAALDRFVERFDGEPFDAVAGIEARGFVLAAALSYAMDKGLILVRKHGKLPAETYAESYSLEYGTSCLEIHRDACEPGQRVLIVDDLLATGGTARATAALVGRLGAAVHAHAFLIELQGLRGRAALDGADVFALLEYPA